MSKEAEGQNPTTSKHLPKTYIKVKHPPAHDLGSVRSATAVGSARQG